jgi:hypothetical protein
MHFTIELTVPNTATPTNPAREFAPIPRGIITQVDIEFSPNVNGTVKCQIYLEGQQIYPNVTGKAYRLWTNSITFRDNYPTFPKESKLELRAWADGARYYHTIQCFITVLPFSSGIRRVSI